MKPTRSFLAALVLAAAFATGASAQVDSTAAVTAPPATPAAPAPAATPAPQGVQNLAGGYLIGSFPQGDWGEIAGFGLALDGTDIVKTPGRPFGVRSSFGVLYNFSRTVDVPSANLAANDKLSIETKNWSLFFGIGPEIAMGGKGGAPFIFGVVGFDTYWTSSTLSGTAGGSSYSAEHGDSRIAFAWGAGLGFRRNVTPGSSMELSAEYRSGADHQYLRPGDVTSGPGGVVADRSGHRSDQILVRIGTVLGSAY